MKYCIAITRTIQPDTLSFLTNHSIMKKLILIAVICSLAWSANAQDSTQSNNYKNEFGLDVTGFLQQFLYMNGSQFPNYYTPVYYLTYRRHIGKCNLRAAIGGLYYHQPFESPFINDQNEYERNTQQFDLRVGWEWTSEISRRWQAFYGLDYRQGFMHDYNDAPYWNAGYANGRESTTISYGIAPVLGIRFRLNERISLSTEASLNCRFETYENRRFFLSTDPNSYPPLPDVVDPKVTSFQTSFAQPLSVFLTIDF